MLSWIWPPMAMVSPSCTVTCVVMDLVAKEGDWMFVNEGSVACGSLMLWLMIMVTMPLGVTRAVIFSPIPVLTFETPVVTDPVIPLAVEPASEGTVVPTLIDAGILSVAMIEGEEIIFALLSDSMSCTMPDSVRLLPTNMEADKLTPLPVSDPNSEAAVFVTTVDPVVPVSDVKAAVTLLEKLWDRSME